VHVGPYNHLRPASLSARSSKSPLLTLKPIDPGKEDQVLFLVASERTDPEERFSLTLYISNLLTDGYPQAFKGRARD
jgi:hypothetical protein